MKLPNHVTGWNTFIFFVTYTLFYKNRGQILCSQLSKLRNLSELCFSVSVGNSDVIGIHNTVDCRLQGTVSDFSQLKWVTTFTSGPSQKISFWDKCILMKILNKMDWWICDNYFFIQKGRRSHTLTTEKKNSHPTPHMAPKIKKSTIH